MSRFKITLIITVVVLVGAATWVGIAAAQSTQRFNDVPADHPAHAAVEWAAGTGLTTGYDDGTFKPERPLSKRHAVVFMERFYDEILRADKSEDFTRADMMVLLKAINDGGDADVMQPTTTTTTVVPATTTTTTTTTKPPPRRTCTHNGRGHGNLGYNPGTHTHPTDDHRHASGKCEGV